MTSVLDTSSFSAAMRLDTGVVAFLRSRRPGEVATVPPVVAEVEYGIQRTEPGSRRRRLLEQARDHFLPAIRLLPWTPEASVRFGSIKASLERAGEPIDDFDIAIAAIAMAHDAEVVTANLVHFRRVEGLACRHWAD